MMTSDSRVEEIRARFAKEPPFDAIDPRADIAFLLAAYDEARSERDQARANAAGLRDDVAAANNRADRLQAELDRVTRERDEAVQQRDVHIVAHELMTRQFRTMQLEKEHGWRESERAESKMEAAEAALQRVRALAEQYDEFCSGTVKAAILVALSGTSGTPTGPLKTDTDWDEVVRDLFTEGHTEECDRVQSAGEWPLYPCSCAVSGPAGTPEEPAEKTSPLNPNRELCGHCGQVARGSAHVGGIRVCHPDVTAYPDCYRLVTVYKEPLGSRIAEQFHRSAGSMRAWDEVDVELESDVPAATEETTA